MLTPVKAAIQSFVRTRGFEFSRVHSQAEITGTFPPFSHWFDVGKPENYFIRDGYQPRSEVPFFDDTPNNDYWQDEVYRFAHEIAARYQLTVICDVGCGSAYKLLKYFSSYTTVGIEMPPTCAILRTRYPHKRWVESDFFNPLRERIDLLICADVIEHLAKPNQLLDYIKAMNPRFVVLSTPERNLRTNQHLGPPQNAHHFREWSFAEFHAYVNSRFHILEHFISNAAQNTQCVLAC